MTMFEFYTFLLVFALGWTACRIYMAIKIHKTIKKIVEENRFTLEELNKDLLYLKNLQTKGNKVPNMFTEFTDKSILLFNKDTGNFVGQATTLDELAINLYQFDKVKFANVEHNEKSLWFVEGKVQDNFQDLNES